MARKNKRSQTRKPQRGGAGSARAARPGGAPPVLPAHPVSDAPAPPSAATTPAASAPGGSTRMVQRPLPRARGRQQAAGPLPSEDASIPLDRVPYFRGDVLRIAVTAGVMFVLLVVGAFVLRGMLGA